MSRWGWLLVVWAVTTSSLVALLVAAIVSALRAGRREPDPCVAFDNVGRRRRPAGDDVTQPFGGLQSRRGRR